MRFKKFISKSMDLQCTTIKYKVLILFVHFDIDIFSQHLYYFPSVCWPVCLSFCLYVHHLRCLCSLSCESIPGTITNITELELDALQSWHLLVIIWCLFSKIQSKINLRYKMFSNSSCLKYLARGDFHLSR